MDRRLTFGLAIAAAAACGGTEVLEPKRERDPNAPRIYRVLNGDSLATIASKRSTTPELLRTWNELPPGEPLPGTILLIYPKGTIGPTAPAGTASHPLVINDPEVETQSQPQPPATPPNAAPPVASRRVAVTPSGAPGLLGSESRAIDVPLSSPVGPAARRAPPGTPSLGDRSSLGAGPTADLSSPAIQRNTPTPQPAGQWSAGTARALPPAPARPCLPPPDDAAEGEMILARGLSKVAIKSAMRPVVSAADSCLTGSGQGTFQVTLEVVAGCDGRVASVTVADLGGLPAGVGACVVEVAKNASFETHDDSAGTVFLYPIRFVR